MAGPSDEAIKTRIITHMNKDHPDSLSRYLEVFTNQSHFSARAPKLQDFTLASMTISSASGIYTVPISPPLTSYAESRTRLVAMHEECGKKLGRDEVTIKTFQPPRTIVEYLVIIGVLLGLVSFWDGANFAPGSFLAETLFRPLPAVAKFAEEWYRWFWWGIIGLHLAEAGVMAKWLQRHNVQPLGRIWWLWVCFTALEGYGCGKRFKAEVRMERRKKEKKTESH